MTSKNNRVPLLCYVKLCASFQSHWWIQTGVRIRKCPLQVKIGNFLPRVTLKFDGWPWKTIGHLFYAIPASIATLAQRQPLCWANVGSPTLGQRGFVNWPNVGPTVACQRWPNIGPLTLGQRYANGCMPTLYQHWPNGGCVTGLFVRGPHRSPMVSLHKGPGTLALMFA